MKKAVVIGGQTGAGKSSLALELCRVFEGEIVSADSMQVYRGMDIGTAKPTREDLLSVPHHLIDILDTEQGFSSADFVAAALDAMRGICERGRIPFVVGGTGLYSQMLFDSFELENGRGDPKLRSAVAAEAAERGPQAMYEELRAVDPEAASRTHPNNGRRVIRYIELYRATGMTPTRINALNNSGKREYDPLFLCLWSSDRELIYRRINERVDAMFDAGLEREARSLWERGLENTPTARAAIGYKELFPYFRGEITLSESKELIKRHSRNYAKRQQTYFKRINGCVFIDIAEDPAEKAKTLIKSHLENTN